MSSQPETVSLYQFFQRFPGEEAAREYFERNRWNGEVSCPHCGSLSIAAVKDAKPMPYRCRDCRQHFSVRSGTVLAESRLPLHKWLMAIYMMTTARKGIPSTQMARELGVTQKSAWFLAQRIRETWLSGSGGMGDHLQVDETYVGGREKNKHADKKLHAGRGTVGKTAVVGIRSEAGEVRAAVTKDTKAPTLEAFVRKHANDGANANTDLVREGERTDTLFIVADGWACRYTTTREGGRQLPALLVPGDVGNLDSLRAFARSVGSTRAICTLTRP